MEKTPFLTPFFPKKEKKKKWNLGPLFFIFLSELEELKINKEDFCASPYVLILCFKKFPGHIIFFLPMILIMASIFFVLTSHIINFFLTFSWCVLFDVVHIRTSLLGGVGFSSLLTPLIFFFDHLLVFFMFFMARKKIHNSESRKYFFQIWGGLNTARGRGGFFSIFFYREGLL